MQDWERKKRRGGGERKATGAQDGEERQLFIEPNARTKKRDVPFGERQFMILIVERSPAPPVSGWRRAATSGLVQAWYRRSFTLAKVVLLPAAKVPPQYYLLLLPPPSSYYFLPLIHPSILLTPSQPSFPSARP